MTLQCALKKETDLTSNGTKVSINTPHVYKIFKNARIVIGMVYSSNQLVLLPRQKGKFSKVRPKHLKAQFIHLLKL